MRPNAGGGRATRTPAILFEAHQNAFGDGVDSPRRARGGQVFPRLDVDQQVGALLLDAVVLNSDRHANNWLYAGDPDNGDAVYLPVDHGAIRVIVPPLEAATPRVRMLGWFNGQTRHDYDARTVQGRSRDELREAVVRFQDSARQRAEAVGSLESNLNDIIAVGEGVAPVADTTRRMQEIIQENYQFLLDSDAEVIVDLLLSGR